MRTLAILAGCPNGATADALALQGISKQTLNRLAGCGLIEAKNQRHSSPPDLVVTRYWIALAGTAGLGKGRQ